MCAESSARRRPLNNNQHEQGSADHIRQTYVKFISSFNQRSLVFRIIWTGPHLPVIINRLDYETQGWAHRIDILIHNLLHDRRFAGIIQATIQSQHMMTREFESHSQHQNPHLLVFQTSFPQDRQHPFTS